MPYGGCICEVPGCIGPCVTRAKSMNEAPRFTRSETYELVDLSMSVATQFALQGKTAEAAAEVERAAIYLRELKRLRDGQPG